MRMHISLKQVYVFIATAMVLLGVACSERVAGPSTEEGNPAYTCVVIDTNGTRIQGAEITVFCTTLLSSDTSRPIPAKTQAYGLTGTNGEYSLSILPFGTYTIESRQKSTGFGAVHVLQIGTNSTAPIFDTLMVKPGCTINGVVTRDGNPGVMNNVNKFDAFIDVMIAETGQTAVTRYDGAFQFTEIPPGDYTLLFYADDGFFTTRVDSVITVSGVPLIIDTVRLQRFPWINPPKPDGFNASYDTTGQIVRIWWNPVKSPDIRGYEVVRYNALWQEDKVYTTTDTTVVDTVSACSPGSTISYVMRSVNFVFARSYNEGPIDITIK